MLIVDDETVQLRLMHQIIAALKPDYLIDTASRAQSALHLMETSAYDVVLTDIRMPGMDGLEMIRVAKERELGTELFIILSGFDDFKYAAAGNSLSGERLPSQADSRKEPAGRF